MLRGVQAYVGTSGFSYPEWKGNFYPEKLPNTAMLGYYAEQLGTVEINNTFYRLPRASVLAGWATKVPEQFRFAVKASRRITHFQKLADAGELLGYLFEVLGALGPKLGPVLFQLPPTFRADTALLTAFLEQLPPGVRAAFEFRHPSWFDDATYEALSARGAALVGGDLDEAERSPPLVRTADFTYLRLRRESESYTSAELEEWAGRLRGLGVSEAFVYFKHEVLGPSLAKQLMALLSA
jgi:uncharacterized protein YecE (DUF72 family)